MASQKASAFVMNRLAMTLDEWNLLTQESADAPWDHITFADACEPLTTSLPFQFRLMEVGADLERCGSVCEPELPGQQSSSGRARDDAIAHVV